MGKRVGDDTRARAVVLALEVRDISRAMEWLAALGHKQGIVRGQEDAARQLRAYRGKPSPRHPMRNPYAESAAAPE